ncbi:MAG: hypothetical protein GY754_32595 [bacterium]|nr:hypothetical protein [bacterium]
MPSKAKKTSKTPRAPKNKEVPFDRYKAIKDEIIDVSEHRYENILVARFKEFKTSLITEVLEPRFKEIDSRFNFLDSKFDTKIGALDTKIGALDEKIDTKVGALDEKIDTKIGALDAKIDTKVGALDTKIGALDSKFDAKFGSLEKRMGFLTWFLPLIISMAMTLVMSFFMIAMKIIGK